MNQEEADKESKLKLDRLKGSWYHATPEKLYDLCVKKVVRNVELILTKRSTPQPGTSKKVHRPAKSRYKVREGVGPLPSPICESLIREYARYYVETLAQLERDEYFNSSGQERQQRQLLSNQLISYYDVLMAFVCTPDKCSLASIDYRQCMWATSTLESRLRQKLEAQLQRQQPVESSYFKVVKSRLGTNSNSTKQRHQLDNDLMMMNADDLDDLVDVNLLDDDDDNFDAYLQEYVNRYEQQQQHQQQQQQQQQHDNKSADSERATRTSGSKKRRHKSGKKKKKHHRHDCPHYRSAKKSAKRSSLSQQKKKKKHRRKHQEKFSMRRMMNYQIGTYSDGSLSRGIGDRLLSQTEHRLPACKLFAPSLSKKPGRRRGVEQRSHKSSRHRVRRKHRHGHKSKQAKSGAESLLDEIEKNSAGVSNAPAGTVSSTSASTSTAVAAASLFTSTAPTAILKWLVKRAIMNTNASSLATVYSAPQSPQPGTSSASATAAAAAAAAAVVSDSTGINSNDTASAAMTSTSGAASAGTSSGGAVSLIAQLKKKASLLAETKMIDKVSISSSNYDEYDLNNMNSGGGSNLIDSQSINEQDCESAEIEMSSSDQVQQVDEQANNPNKSSETKFITDFDSVDSHSFNSDSSSIYLSYHTNESMKSNRSSSVSDSSSSEYTSSSASSSSSSLSLLSSLSLMSTSSADSFSSASSQCSCSCDDDAAHGSSDTSDSSPSSSTASSSSTSSLSTSASSSSLASSMSSSPMHSDVDELARRGSRHSLSALEKRYMKKKRRRLSKKLKEISERLGDNYYNDTASTLEDKRGGGSAGECQKTGSGVDGDVRLLAVAANSKKVQRQQKLLEKVANLGSSPINVIQAIAAKALNFKLKNSRAAAMRTQSQQLLYHHQHEQFRQDDERLNNSSSSSSSSATSLNNTKKMSNLDFDSASSRRLMRQYKFLRSTNMTEQAGASSSSTGRVDQRAQVIDEIIRNLNDQVSSELEHQTARSTLTAEDTSSSPIDQLLDTNYSKSKRLKEEDDRDNCTGSADRPGTSKSFEQQPGQQQQQQQQQQSLFSVLKYWMSKRVDPIGGSNEAIMSSGSTQTDVNADKMEQNDMDESGANRQQNKRKSVDQKTTGASSSAAYQTLNTATLFDPKMNRISSKKKKSSRQADGLSSHHHHNHNQKKHNHHDHLKQHRKSQQRRMASTHPGGGGGGTSNMDFTLVQTLNLSRLQHLSLRNLGPYVIKRTMLNSLLKNFKCLKYLDISNCCTNQLFVEKRGVSADVPPSGVDMAKKSRFLVGVDADLQPQASMNQPSEKIGCLDGLINLAPTLTHLLMADLNVDDIQANLKFILKLKSLKHLDVSNCREKPPLNRYKNPSLLLAKLVYHLTGLTSLDISGTNLTGPLIFKEQDEIDYIKKRLYDDLTDEYNDYSRVRLDDIETVRSGIAGLMFINNEQRRLDFLGAFCCDNSISSRSTSIPAVRIASESAEAYIYTALECFLNDRPLFLLDALNHLFELYRDESVEDKLRGGHLIMDTMERHLDNSRIQISGSASLFYVLKYWKEENFRHLPPFYLKRLILAVINGMEQHIDESAMRRNCVLIMCRLNLPDDVLFVSDRLIRILLKIFEDYIEEKQKNSNDRPEHFVLRTAMHLLNILACSVHGNDKSKVGALSIPVAMNLIKTKTKFREPDDVLEVTWSFLWNITDETPENCETFLDKCDGMNAFMECIQFKKPEILRNMMGLLGNVAEVRELRNRLCKSELISTFRQLLFQTNDGIEIAYNSAGVLVHIMSDGADAWSATSLEHERNSIILDIETAIDKWDIHSDRNINYRSFQPIFRLVEQFENPICQLWSCWALANLTTVYPETYCPLFEREQGRELMERVLNNPNVNDAIKRYSQLVLSNVNQHNAST